MAEETLQRPPAETRYADELARLRSADEGSRPPGWWLSLEAARRFVVGDERQGIRRKFVGDPSLIDRALVSLATAAACCWSVSRARPSRCCPSSSRPR
jgi:hypothetical protein